MHDLAQHEVNELHVEAGQKLNGALLREGCVDELLLYLAPKFLGAGLGMSDWGPLQNLTQALSLTFTETELIGKDLRVLARVKA
jgi:diaminohydroxyphosphoribosylaminopyrimidine deaminase/5-amino-6-(5-phosphoribosylamino)uracil reductase